MKRSTMAAFMAMAALAGTDFVPHETKRPTAIINTPRNHEERIRKAKDKRARKNATRLARERRR